MKYVRRILDEEIERKIIFIDPSIGLAALGIGPDYFNRDLDLFGHVFENMILRDLLVYARAHNAHIMHYTDDMGLEADALIIICITAVMAYTTENSVKVIPAGCLKD